MANPFESQIPSSLTPLSQAAFLHGGIPTDDDLTKFVLSVRPEYSKLIAGNPQATYGFVREILQDPGLSQEARQKLGDAVFNAVKYRAPYAMGDKEQPESFKHTFGQPSSHNRVKSK